MAYETIYGNLEDYAEALKFSKSNQVWFRISRDPATQVEGEKTTKLEDGTLNKEKRNGWHLSAKIKLTALGFLVPDTEPKQMGASLNPAKPDTLIVCNLVLVEKDCFEQGDLEAFEKEVTVSYQGVIKEIEKTHSPIFCEGAASILS